MVDKPYISMLQIGFCKVCGREEDLRFGACFDCADHCKVQDVGSKTFRVWDERNPSNQWLVVEPPNFA